MTAGGSKVIAAAAVGIGGCMGTALRCVATSLLPSSSGFPASTFLINITGAFVLGFLLEYLLICGEDTGMRRIVRLCAGTGFCGGFTTYGTLAFESTQLFGSGSGLVGIGYLGASVCAGVVATMAGFVAAQKIRRLQEESR